MLVLTIIWCLLLPHVLSSMVDDLEKQVNYLDTENDILRTRVGHLRQLVAERRQMATPAAFHASLSSDESFTFGATVTFDQVLLNQGGGYDATFGFFSCPTEAKETFWFAVSIRSPAAKQSRAVVYLDKQDGSDPYPLTFVDTYMVDQVADSGTHTCQAVVQCEPNFRVYVGVDPQTGNPEDMMTLMAGSSFTGHRL